MVAHTHLVLGLVAEGINAVTTVESNSNLLVCVNEALQLLVELNVLSSQYIAVMLESVNLPTHVNVLGSQRLGRETQVLLLASVAG